MSKDKHPPLLIREQYEGMFAKLTDAERGKLLSALMNYQWHQREPDKLPERLFGYFEALRSFSDDDNRKYTEKCEKNRSNAMKRNETQ